MKEYCKGHKVMEFLYKHIFDILFGLPSLVTIIGWVKHVICKAQYTPLEILLSILVLLTTLLWIFIGRIYYGYPTTCRKTQYKFLTKTIKYTRHDDNSLFIQRSVVVKSNVNGLDRIKDRYIWTGKELATLIPKRGKNVSGIHLEEGVGIWKYFSVNFYQTISKGNTIDIDYKWPSIKECTSSSPFVSTDTEYETKKIVFEIDLGKDYANHEIMLEEYRSIESECPIRYKSIMLNDEGRYRWEIEKPKRYRYFRVRWTWNNSKET